MNYMNIVSLGEIDSEEITYSEPIIGDKLNQMYISYADEPFLVYLPGMLFLNGLITTQSKCCPNAIYLKLKGETEEITDQVLDFFKGLDTKMILDGKENKEDWPFIGKDIEYKTLVKNIDGLTVKLKFINNGNISTKVFNTDGDLVSKNDYDIYFQGPCFIKSVLEIVSVWFKKGMYGLHVKLHQLEIDI